MLTRPAPYSPPLELLGSAAHRADVHMVVREPWYRLRMERTLALLPFAKDRAFSTLDLGCGIGLYDFALARIRPKALVVGVDLNQTQVQYANDAARRLGLADRLVFEQADVTCYRPAQKFDVVLMTEMLEHLEDPRSCLEVARLALRGGA